MESEFKHHDLALLGKTTGLPFKLITDMLIDSQQGGRVSSAQIALPPRIFCTLSRDFKELHALEYFISISKNYEQLAKVQKQPVSVKEEGE